MSEVTQSVLTASTDARQKVDSRREGIESFPSSFGANVPDPKKCLSNAILLFDTLDEFFKEPKAEFLPHTITQDILKHLEAIKSEASGVPEGAATPDFVAHVARLLQSLDQLYALCLKAGVITFGFEKKIAQQYINRFRYFTGNAESRAKEFDKNLTDLVNAANDALSKLKASATEAHSQALALLQQKAGEVDQVISSVKSQSDSVALLAKESTRAEGDIRKLETIAKASRESLDTIVRKAEQDQVNWKSTSDNSLQAIQTSEKQAQDNASSCKVLTQQATESYAAISLKLDEIKTFHADIDKYKQEMIDARKHIISEMNSLKAGMESQVQQFGARTDTVLKANEGFVKEIQDHLRNAVGASLFSAFDVRRGKIFKSKIFWAVLLALAICGAVTFGVWFISHLTAPEINLTTIVARLILAIPLTFFVYFCSKQFDKERQAEEEYAFKSVISVSLESYRQLLDRMHKENPGGDTEYIKKLIYEIFENPVRRLYAERGGKAGKDNVSDVTELVRSISEIGKAATPR